MSWTLAISGTGTGVGKTHVTAALVRGWRARGRRVWVHKPVACGDWDGHSADDGRRLRQLAGDGQPVDYICPLEFAEPAAPHLAAAAAGASISAATLTHQLDRCRGADHDLIVEGAGGLCSPLTSDRLSFSALLPRWNLPTFIVTRPDLGTLHATAATVHVAKMANIVLLGLVINEPEPVADSLAVRSAATELSALTGVPVLGWIRHDDDQAQEALAATVLTALERSAHLLR